MTNTETTKKTGTVTWFAQSGKCNGTGYIRSNGGTSYFFRWSDLVMDGYRSCDAGDMVAFTVEKVDGKPDKASEVEVILPIKKIRAELRKRGFKLKKGRDIYGAEGYMVVDDGNYIVAGDNFELDLEDVSEFIREDADAYNERCLQREVVMDMRYDVVVDILQDFGKKIPFAEWSSMRYKDLVAIYDKLAAERGMPPYIKEEEV